jgi:single-strand DNA-binding protein
MNSLRNKVQLIGNLGQNPEVRTFENGKVMAKFSLATKESYRDSSGKKILETQWHNIVAWGPIVKTIEKYLVKGSEIAVEGKLMHRVYDDKEGNKKYFTEIVMNDMVLFFGKDDPQKEAQ